jgi:hypothetical protein
MFALAQEPFLLFPSVNLCAVAGRTRRAEALSFPAARNDDFCDALGLIGQILDRLYAPTVPAPHPPLKILSMDPSVCNVTLTDLFEQADRRHKRSGSRIA